MPPELIASPPRLLSDPGKASGWTGAERWAHLGVMRIPQVLLVVLLLWLVPGLAAAEQDRVSGFSTESKGVITGQVTEESGEPARGVTVYATTVAGELTAITDDAGHYRIDLGTIPGSKMIFVRKVARINGQTMVQSTTEEGEEVVEILEAAQPQVMPKPTSPTNRIPEYSREARDADVWTKAWLLLHVGRDGEVKRLKVLHAPGYELDEVAVRDAFALRFEPALDRAGRPVPVLVLWSYEWPSYWWMVEHRHPPRAVPAEVNAVPCRGTQGAASRQRDCTQAEMSQAHTLPWIGRKKFLASGKLGKMGHSKLALPPVTVQRATGPVQWYDSKLGWTLAGAGAVFGVTSAFLLVTAQQLDDKADMNAADPLITSYHQREAASARRTAGYIFGAMGVAMTIAGVRQFAIHADRERATASVAWRF